MVYANQITETAHQEHGTNLLEQVVGQPPCTLLDGQTDSSIAPQTGRQHLHLLAGLADGTANEVCRHVGTIERLGHLYGREVVFVQQHGDVDGRDLQL